MFCINCGTQTVPEAKFCAACGAALQARAPEEIPSSRQGPPPQRSAAQSTHMNMVGSDATAHSTVSSMRIEDVVFGQKCLIYATIPWNIYWFLYAFKRASHLEGDTVVIIFALISLLIWYILPFVGGYYVTRGLSSRVWVRLGIFVSLLIPYLNLGMMLYLNKSATGALRSAGYSVGLLGVKDYKRKLEGSFE